MKLTSIDITSLTIGEVLKSVLIVVAIIFALYEIGSKLYDYFMKAHQNVNKEEEFRLTVERHSEEIQVINEKIDNLVNIIEKNEEQTRKVDCAILRDRIIQSYSHHKDSGSISALDYENLNEMFTQYFARGGNHLVSKIYEDFQTWKVNIQDYDLF